MEKKVKEKSVGCELYCEATGVLLRIDGDPSPGDRYFSSEDVADAHAAYEQAMGTRLVHLDAVHVDESRNVRDVVRDDTEYTELYDSIKKQGILQPVVVKRTFEHAPCSYRLITGFRRASVQRDLGEQFIPVRVISEEVDDTSAAIIENVCRKDMHPLELSLALEKLRVSGKRDPETKKVKPLSNRDLVAMTGIGASKVSDHLMVAHNISNQVLEAYENKSLSFSKVMLLAKIEDKKEQQKLLPRAIQVSVAELRSIVSDLRKKLGTEPKNKKSSPSKDLVDRFDRKIKIQPVEFLVAELEIAEDTLDSNLTDDITRERVGVLQYALGIIESINSEIDMTRSTETLRKAKAAKKSKSENKAKPEKKENKAKPEKKENKAKPEKKEKKAKPAKKRGKAGSDSIDLSMSL